MDKAESIFFRVLADIKEYLDNLVLVGGWVPYIYAKYLWGRVKKMPLGTSDIDLGVPLKIEKAPGNTIYDKLSSKYGEHHISMDRMFPVVFHLENVEIHFISSKDITKQTIDKLVGRQIHINEVDSFEVLLNNTITIDIADDKFHRYKIYIPKPAAYIYHKGLTFIDRQSEESKAKDLHYIYYVLRFAPDLKSILSEVSKFEKDKDYAKFKGNLRKYFERISSQGCLMVEKENGPDEYIENIRQDIFERFNNLIEHLR